MAENALRGGTDKLIPPAYLSCEQQEIFLYIEDELLQSGILGNLDVFVLAQCAVAIDRMQDIDKRINENNDLLWDNKLMATREKYTKSFYRCCNELSLSPQARAKMANTNMSGKAKEADPVLTLLGGNKPGGTGT